MAQRPLRFHGKLFTDEVYGAVDYGGHSERLWLMDLGHLRYFQTIARCQSLTRAARELGLSQPTLTVAVQQLEKNLGTTLFLRDPRGVSLTETGRELARHVEEIFQQIERAERDIADLEKGEAGRFVIGCHESLGAYFLPGFMSEFLRTGSSIELSLWNGPSSAVGDAVVDRRVHFGLIVNPRPHPELVLVELFKDAMDLFVAAGPERMRTDPPPMSDRPRLSLSEESLRIAHQRLREGPLIFAGRVQQCQELLEMLTSERLLPSRLLSCGDLELVKSLVLADLGVALLPRRVAAYQQKGKLRRLHPSLPFIPDTIYLAYRADIHRTRATIRVKDALVAHGRTLDDMG